LGKAVREKYKSFLPDNYNFVNVEVISSNWKRTLVSASSQLQGLFDLGTGSNIEVDDPAYYNPPIKDFDIPFPDDQKGNALPFRPTFVPIQSADNNKNYLFNAHSDCP